MLSRRKLIGSLISLIAAPAIVRVSSIMPVKAFNEDWRYLARAVDVPFTTLGGVPIYMDDLSQIVEFGGRCFGITGKDQLIYCWETEHGRP